MAPLVASSAVEWTLTLGVVGSVTVAISILIGIAICGCCDEDAAQGKGKAGGGSKKEKSQISGKKAPPKKVDVNELANRFKVSELEMQTLVDRFKAMDVNGDGSLTESELVEAMAKLDQPITRQQAANFIKQYDKDGDGCMQLEEFITMVTRRRKWSQPDADKAALKAFKEFDKNNDGNISADELCAAMGEMGDPINKKEAEEMIKMADKNKDGNISYEEFVAFWKQYTVG